MKRYAVKDLLFLMQRLRDPEYGCPWDLKQTFETIARYTLEEAYEVIDAIDDEDFSHLQEELGDLLLQVVFHAQIANESALFNFDEVVHALVVKLIRRHPHVFPDGDLYATPQSSSVRSSDEVKRLWENIKQQEKTKKQEQDHAKGILGDITRALPALKRAQKLQEKAAHYGFDWSNTSSVFDKLREEIDELEHEVKEQALSKVQTEFGDLLFSMVALARHLKLDAEQSLGLGNHKFCRRFVYIEQTLSNKGKQLEQASIETMDQLWEEAKQRGL